MSPTTPRQRPGNGEPQGIRAPRVARQYRPGRSRHMENTIMSALVRVGLVPRSCLLTTRGGKTGRPRTNPVVPVELGGRRWLVAPYGPVSWVHNARAAGQVSLTRRRDTRDYAIREVSAEEAGPVLEVAEQCAGAECARQPPAASLPPVTEERDDGGDRTRRSDGRRGLEPGRGGC
jgi:deazaflavin-dependent oxidoreductase (nitroreductase family)